MTADKRMMQSYLGDHLTGASGGRARVHRMASDYADHPIGPSLAELAREIDEEHAHLDDLMHRLGLHRALPLRAVARAGELAGRFKPNGRLLAGTPTTMVFELELLRAAVNGKQGVWDVLEAYADELGLDPAEYRRRAETAERQEQMLKELHAQVRSSTFEPS